MGYQNVNMEASAYALMSYSSTYTCLVFTMIPADS